MDRKRYILLSIGLIVVSGCTTPTTTEPPIYSNDPPPPTSYRDVESKSRAGGIGVEGRDIVSMADDMVRDLLTSGVFGGHEREPRIVIDSTYLTNESSARVNKNVITDLLLTNLVRASRGQMYFVDREMVRAAEQERALKRDGVVDSGTVRMTGGTAGADYRLVGRITSLDAVNSSTGVHDKTYVFTFRLNELETSAIAYAFPAYTISKFGADDAVYR